MKKFAVQKIATKGGNFLVSDGENYAYFDKKYNFLRMVDEDEWDWALRTWEENPKKASLKLNPFPRVLSIKIKPEEGDDSSEIRYYYFPKNHPKCGIVKMENIVWWYDGDEWRKSVDTVSLQQAINLKGGLRERTPRSQFIVDKNKKQEEEWRETLVPIKGVDFSPQYEGDYNYSFSIYLPCKDTEGRIKLFGDESYKLPEASVMKAGSFKRKEIHILNKDMEILFSFCCSDRREDED